MPKIQDNVMVRDQGRDPGMTLVVNFSTVALSASNSHLPLLCLA